MGGSQCLWHWLTGRTISLLDRVQVHVSMSIYAQVWIFKLFYKFTNLYWFLQLINISIWVSRVHRVVFIRYVLVLDVFSCHVHTASLMSGTPCASHWSMWWWYECHLSFVTERKRTDARSVGCHPPEAYRVNCKFAVGGGAVQRVEHKTAGAPPTIDVNCWPSFSHPNQGAEGWDWIDRWLGANPCWPMGLPSTVGRWGWIE